LGFGQDIEKLRAHLGIEQWVVSVAAGAPIVGLQSDSSNTGTNFAWHFSDETKELRWFYQEGANYFFPDAWENYVKPIP